MHLGSFRSVPTLPCVSCAASNSSCRRCSVVLSALRRCCASMRAERCCSKPQHGQFRHIMSRERQAKSGKLSNIHRKSLEIWENPKILRASRTLECISATLLCLLESELHVAHGLFKGLQPPYFQLPWQSRGLAKSHVLWCFRCDSRLGVQPRGSCSTSPSLCRMLSDSALRLWCACCHCAFIRSSSFTWPSKPALCCESTVRF